MHIFYDQKMVKTELEGLLMVGLLLNSISLVFLVTWDSWCQVL